MAEGFARAIRPKEWQVFSAGTNPGSLNKNAVRVMEEVGIDISRQYSKDIKEIKIRPDIVVTLSGNAKGKCSVFAGAQKVLHWDIEDPFDAKGRDEDVLNVYRRVRDKIKGLINKNFI